MAIGESALLFDQPGPCIFNRRANETGRAVGQLPARTLQDCSHPEYPFRLGVPGSRWGCQLSLQVVAESLQFKKIPLFRGLATLRILLAGDDVNRTPINGG